MSKLSGKVALITGGSSGIGLAAAQAFIREGAFVYITGRRQDELEKARGLLGSNVATLQGDVSKLDDLDRLYERIKAEKGHLDVVVANAGFVELQTLANATAEHVDRTFDTNTRGTYFTVAKALPLLRDGAAIVLISSAMNVKGIPAYGAYAASKAAIRSLARTWAYELRERQIRVNSLSPGLVETPIISVQLPNPADADGLREHFRNITPLGRIGTAEEMATAILFLASSDSAYSTGIDLVADGGITSL